MSQSNEDVQSIEEQMALSYEAFLKRAQNELAIKTDTFNNMFHIDEADWSADLEAGSITFETGKHVLTAEIQIVGTYDDENGDWLWGWDHPSVPEPLSRAAKAAKAYGEARGLKSLITRKFTCEEEDAWDFAALACKLDAGQSVYCVPSGNTLVFFVFGELKATVQG